MFLEAFIGVGKDHITVGKLRRSETLGRLVREGRRPEFRFGLVGFEVTEFSPWDWKEVTDILIPNRILREGEFIEERDSGYRIFSGEGQVLEKVPYLTVYGPEGRDLFKQFQAVSSGVDNP